VFRDSYLCYLMIDIRRFVNKAMSNKEDVQILLSGIIQRINMLVLHNKNKKNNFLLW
jgi:hypothetical protein